MAPVSVLASLGQLGGALPRTYVVGCHPADVTEGMGLTPAVEAAVDRAVALVHDVLEEQLGRPAARTTERSRVSVSVPPPEDLP
jgi:hydrogenase maturation protease